MSHEQNKSDLVNEIVKKSKVSGISIEELGKAFKSNEIHLSASIRHSFCELYMRIWENVIRWNNMDDADILDKVDYVHNQLKTKKLFNIKDIVTFIKSCDSACLIAQIKNTSQSKLTSKECCKLIGVDGFGNSIERDINLLDESSSSLFTDKIRELYDIYDASQKSTIANTQAQVSDPASWQYVNAALFNYLKNAALSKTVAVHLSCLDSFDDTSKYFEHWYTTNIEPHEFNLSILTEMYSCLNCRLETKDYLYSEKNWINRTIANMKKFYTKSAPRPSKRQLPPDQ
jgi:hypothetical protein